MLAEAFYPRCIGEAEAFLLAFDEGATYDSPNFQWFRRRYERFVYIDRAPVYEMQFTTMAWERTSKVEEQRRAGSL